MFITTHSLVFLATLFSATNALNDWKVPCLDGTCSWDIPDTDNGASGSVKIWSDNKKLITDITTAADWEIIGCAPDKVAQDIRIVCKTEDSANCQQLFEDSPEGKVVRLPNECGENAFAHISRVWIHEDQSVPSEIARRLVRRQGAPSQVRGVTIDDNFDQVDPSRGEVKFALKGANFPGAKGDIPVEQNAVARRHSSRQLGGLVDKAKNGVKKGVNLVDNIIESFDGIDETRTLPPIKVNKQFNLFKKEVTCEGRSAGVTIDVDANADITVTVGLVATGTLLPLPKIEEFAITTTMDGEINSSIDFKAAVSGDLDSKKQQIFAIALPGLSFPGILQIGPFFKVEAQATATLDLNVDLNVGINYKIQGAKAVLPPRDGDKGSFDIGDTPLKLSASPSVAARGEVQVHLIPALALGIDAFRGKGKADVFINLDASAHAVLTLEAKAEASTTLNRKRAGPARLAIDARQAASTAAKATTAASATSAESTSSAAASSTASADGAVESAAAESATDKSTTATNVGVGGCFEVFAQLGVNAGAEGSFFGIFDATKEISLFDKRFDLFKRCFGNQAKRGLGALLYNPHARAAALGIKRMNRIKMSRELKRLEARALGCPKTGSGAAESLVDSADASAGLS